MSGYPNKISRSSLGPSYQNAAKVGNPKQEADAAIFNLMCWQLAGVNVVAPRAVLIGQADNATISLVKQYLAWDPNGALGPSTFSRTSQGVYTWALPGSGTYSDMNGNAVVFQAEYVQASIMGGTNRLLIADLDTDGNSGSINCFQDASVIDIGSGGLFKRFMLAIY